MTQIVPARSLSTDLDAPAGAEPSMGRLVGVDVARALAVFGMYAVHVGPRAPGSSGGGGVGDWVLRLAEGRSSVLFATLAGFSLILIAGRREPKAGVAGRQAKARIAIRAVILLVFGTVLALSPAGDVVILAYYGVYFLLALPLVGLRARTLAVTAGVLAVVLPQVAFVLKRVVDGSSTAGIDAYDPLERLSGVGVVDLLLTGFYPTITWMPFVVAGMALGRADLASGAVRRRLAVAGAALTVVGYGGARVLSAVFDVPGGVRGAFEDGSGGSGAGSFASGSAGKSWPEEGGSADTAWSLLTAGPHSGTTFDVLGSVGVAIVVVVCATAVLERWPRWGRGLAPVVAVGSMSLTAYVGHFLAMWVFLPGHARPDSAWPLLGFIAGAVVFAAVWSRFFRRGPLEYLLHAATAPASRIR